jgi:hypothetical protein
MVHELQHELKRYCMKKMLLASAAVGAAIAGLILYSRRRTGNADTKALPDVKGNGKAQRNVLHSMG